MQCKLASIFSVLTSFIICVAEDSALNVFYEDSYTVESNNLWENYLHTSSSTLTEPLVLERRNQEGTNKSERYNLGESRGGETEPGQKLSVRRQMELCKMVSVLRRLNQLRM